MMLENVSIQSNTGIKEGSDDLLLTKKSFKIKTLPFLEALDKVTLPNFNQNLFCCAKWLTVLIKTYRLKLFVKYLEREGRVGSYIIYSVVKNFLEWKICLCSYCDYFDCPVADIEDWQILFESLRQEYPLYRVAIRNLRNGILRECAELTLLSREKYHFLDIRPPVAALWKNLRKSFRGAVKQSLRRGVRVRALTRGELRDFYRLHLKVRKNKYRLFPQPFHFFENIWESFIAQDQGILLGAFDSSDRLIAANLYLICADTLYYKFNTSCLHSTQYRPNNLLFWEGIKWGKARGLNFIDLGSSGWDQAGLIQFKDHTGAQAQDIYHLGAPPPGYRFSQKRILKTATRLFTLPWMPDAVTASVSRLIYPFLA